MHISELPSQGTAAQLPDSYRNVLLLLLVSAWLMSPRMYYNMGPGVRNSLQGAEQTMEPVGRLLTSLFHSTVAHRISMDNNVREGEKNTHTRTQ